MFQGCDFNSANDYYQLSIEYRDRGEFDREKEILDMALEKDPNFRPALYNRALYNSDKKEYNDAIVDLKTIIDFDPENTLVLKTIGDIYRINGKFEVSIAWYNKALNTKGALSPDSDFATLDIYGIDQDSDYYISRNEIWFARGYSYLRNDEFQLAVEDYSETVNNNFEKPLSYYRLAEAYIGLNDSTRICKNFIKSAQLGVEEAKSKLRQYCLKQ